ncbi:MAG: hypothetical protein QNK20_01100 [Aureibaculum sp.]|nr:hypothetical protein [Aureibaculum sp.]
MIKFDITPLDNLAINGSAISDFLELGLFIIFSSILISVLAMQLEKRAENKRLAESDKVVQEYFRKIK